MICLVLLADITRTLATGIVLGAAPVWLVAGVLFATRRLGRG